MNDVPQHITVDLPQGAMGKKVGEAMSVRLPIVVTDESGKEIRGFFTKDAFVSTNNLLYSRLGSLQNNEQFRPFLDALSKDSGDIYTSFFQYLYAHAFNMHETRLMDEDEAAKKIAETLGSDRDGYPLLRGYLRDVMHMSDDDINAVAPEQAPDDPQNKAGRPFLQFFSKIVGKAGPITRLTNGHMKMQGQSANSNINRRNNAMSDYADLVGAPDLIARSVNMTVVQDGKATNGTYMLNAEGVVCGDLNIANRALRDNGQVPTSVVLEPEAKRDLSRMQVIDFLCGNVDRHLNNFLFKVDTSDPSTVRIRGVIGIDNDGSFGAIPHTGSPNIRYMSPIQDIKVIDGVQANAILALTPDKLDEKIRLAGLSPAEMKAAHERLAALQKRIRDKDIKIIRSMEQWDALDTQKLETYNKDGSFMNLFNIVGKQMRSFFRTKAVDAPMDSVFPKVKGTVVNVQEDNTLQSHADRLKELQNIDKKYNLRMVTSPTQEPYKKALADTIGELENLQKRLAARAGQADSEGRQPEGLSQTMLRQLTDMERNHLSQRLKLLQEQAEAYASAQHTQLRTKADKHYQEVLLNNAKNVAAFAAEARRQVQTISLEAEQSLAAKLASDITEQHAEQLGIQPKPDYVPAVREPVQTHSYGDLIQELGTVDSRWKHSSPAFKEMIEDLKAVEGSERFPSEQARKLGFQKLTNSINAYLAYKKKEAADGKQPSPYAKQRIQYALKVREFASAHLAAAKQSLTDISQDGKYILDFLNKCKDLKKEFASAKGSDAIQDAQDRIVAFRDEYRKGCQTLLAIAKAHPNDKPTQLACYNNLVNGPIASYRTLYGETKKYLPDIPSLFDAEERAQLQRDSQSIKERCNAFPQTNARNVVSRNAPQARR